MEGLQNQPMSESAPVQNMVPVPEVVPPPQEKMITQDEVNYLMSKAKAEAYEKGKRDTMTTSQPAMSVIDEEQVVAKAVERMQQAQNHQQQQATVQKVVNQFIEKMNAGSQEHPDFDDTVRVLNIPAMAPVVELATDMPNTASLMYEFAKNPEKLQIVQGLIRDGQHGAAKVAMQKLSKSIEDNKKASEAAPKVREPLHQLKPSTNVADLESNSLNAFKRASWARG